MIFNLLSDDESFQKIVRKWAGVSSYFALFVIGSFKIIEAIQWLLRKMYSVVNKRYMGLSREMEFHADEIAAMVTGYLPLKSALLRTDLANHAWSEALQFYTARIDDNIKSTNLFSEQFFVMNYLAEIDGVPMLHGLPDITSTSEKFNKSKLVIKNQWASHPEDSERIERLERSGHISTQQNHSPANNIFSDVVVVQEKLTQNLFEGVSYEGEVVYASDKYFRETYTEEYQKNSFSPIYNNYYNSKDPQFSELVVINGEVPLLTNIFSDEMTDLVYTNIAIKHDIEILNGIAEGLYDIPTFDYDGKKFKQKDALSVANQLTAEAADLDQKILENDINIFRYFLLAEQQQKKDRLKTLYTRFFEYAIAFETKLGLSNSIYKLLEVTDVPRGVDDILDCFRKIEPLETELKEQITLLINGPVAGPELKATIKSNFGTYLSKPFLYFDGQRYVDESLIILYDALRNYTHLIGYVRFQLKAELLSYQASLLAAADVVCADQT
jgi:hypothetical protein